MGQVAFDTQEFVETLENAGLPKEQARAISIAVRKSHEVADVATKHDLADVKKELSSEITIVKRDLEDVRKELKSEINDIRKDLEMMRKDIIIKMGGMFVIAVGVLAAIIKLPL